MTGPSDEQLLAHVPASGDCVFLYIEANANGDLGISRGYNAHCHKPVEYAVKPGFCWKQACSLQMKQAISGTFPTHSHVMIHLL